MSGKHPYPQRLDGVSWIVGLAFWALCGLSVLWFGEPAIILVFGIVLAACWGAYRLGKGK